MSAITIENDLVHYEVLGRGRPVIFVHGWLGSWRYWVPTMQQLSMKYRTYALDLWGFGDSGKQVNRYGFKDQVRLLYDFMEKLGIAKAALVGHSLGAAICLRFASQYPDRAPRVMLVSPPLFDVGGLEDLPGNGQSMSAPTPLAAPIPAPIVISAAPAPATSVAPTPAAPPPVVQTPPAISVPTTSAESVSATPVAPTPTVPAPATPVESAPAPVAQTPPAAPVPAAPAVPVTPAESAPAPATSVPPTPVAPTPDPVAPVPVAQTPPAALVPPAAPTPSTGSTLSSQDTLPRNPLRALGNTPEEILANLQARNANGTAGMARPGIETGRALPPAAPSLPINIGTPILPKTSPLSPNVTPSSTTVPAPTPQPPTSPEVPNPLVSLLSGIKPGALLIKHVDRDAPDLDKLRAEVEKTDEIALTRSAQSFAGVNLAMELHHLASPTLLLHGQDDPFIPPPDGNLIRKISYGKAEGHLLAFIEPDLRHFPMLEITAKFNRLLMDFLDAQDLTNVQFKDQWIRVFR